MRNRVLRLNQGSQSYDTRTAPETQCPFHQLVNPSYPFLMPLHHVVPQMLLRRFAMNGKILQVVSREDPWKKHRGSVSKVGAESGFYRIPAKDVDPSSREDHDPEGVEAGLSVIESKVSPILTVISRGGIPTRGEDRFWLSLFVATQITRGWAYRESVEALGNTLAKQHFDSRDEMLRRRTKSFLESRGEPSKPKDVDRFIELTKSSGWKIVPNKSHLIQQSLKKAWFPLGPALHSRSLRIFRFDEPLLLTSDAAVGFWAPDSEKPRSVGVGNARGIFMSIDRFTAVGFMLDRKDRDVTGNPFWAKHINLSIAGRATKWIYHHPDDNPLLELSLPAPAKLVTVYDTETALADGRIKRSGRHIWR